MTIRKKRLRRIRDGFRVLCGAALLVWTGIANTASTAAPPAPLKRTASEKIQARWVRLPEQDWERHSSRIFTSSEVDDLVAKEVRAAGFPLDNVDLTTDEQFIRRVSLDLAGQLPRPADIAVFVASTNPDKRSELIDQLLDSDAFARHWARFWRDVVTARITNRRSMGLTRSFEEWLYEQLRANRSWGEITRSILTAEGELRFTLNQPSAENGGLFFLVAHAADEAEERAAETSRVFLGIQIQCAQCHDHPSEKWTRAEFHEFAAYFARIKFDQLFIDKKLSGVQLITLPDREHKMPSLTNPDVSSVVHPGFLDGQAPGINLTDRERRLALADAVVDKKNRWFAAAYVNRVWGELLGQSFYRHVDDLGPQKEVIFPEVLTALTGSFQASDYDIKALLRTIMNTQAYQRQLAREETSANSIPFAAATPRRLRADVLWDSLVHVLGKLEHGARFHTGGGVRFNSSFLEGRFRAEFDFDPSLHAADVNGTIPQTLLLMNNQVLNTKSQAAKTSVLDRILRDYPADVDAVEQIYLLALARKPTDRETTRCTKHTAESPSRAEAFEDILWALINSTEFQFNR
jgi:hypothetical protein